MCATNSQHADAANPLHSVSGLGGIGTEARTISTIADSASLTTSCLTSEEKAEARKQRAALKARAKTEDKLLAQVRAHGHLHKTMCQEASNGSYFNLPSGRVLHRETCERLIAEGRLVSLRDGLFDDSQTFVVEAGK
ncbi:hypothetical protein [uncultured Brevundimonas sp.]|uniref:hypothetical protein n=1 Tax=uncultured Brevundimonas sp. TaxID=213418 RepID=UPI00263803F4|nr:hypothetical protein [uncultured Brevundimonas sp.]